MDTHLNTYRALPVPFREEKTGGALQKDRHTRVRQTRARDEDFPAQFSYHMTGLRLVILAVVLLGVTLSMLASFVFLFSRAPVHLHLPIFPSSFTFIGLTGVGVGVLLWIMLTSIFKQHPTRRCAQKPATPLETTLFATDGMTALLPHLMDRQTGELLLWQRDSSEGEDESQRQTEQREALHLRQRLRTLQLYDSDDVPGDGGQKERGHIKKIKRRKIFQ